MEPTTYIHGTHSAEQERLAGLNALTNPPFLEFLRLNETDVVLEVGSGLGILANEVARRVPAGEVLGIEFSTEQLARAQVETPNLRFLQGDAHELPFPESRFDVVYCRYLLEHVRDPQRVLQEMHRVLKPGGRAFAMENDMQMLAFDPDCPHFDALLSQFTTLQARFGGDARVGKRLFALFRGAGFREIALSYQPEIHPAGSPAFVPWIENAIAVMEGASPLLLSNGLATEEIEGALAELRGLRTREDACALFHWNRASGVKAP